MVVDLDQFLAQSVLFVGDPSLGCGVDDDAQSIGIQFVRHGLILGAHKFQILGGVLVDEVNFLFRETQTQNCRQTLGGADGIPVRADVAMTGEITLRGRVMPIGGLREKSMAALRNGIHTVIIPKDNEKDLEKIDQTVRNALTFIPVSHVDQVLAEALEQPPLAAPAKADDAIPGGMAGTPIQQA